MQVIPSLLRSSPLESGPTSPGAGLAERVTGTGEAECSAATCLNLSRKWSNLSWEKKIEKICF